MKILIFTAATGGGHRTTSQAMKTYFSKHIPNAQVRVVDCLREINYLVDKTVCGSYEFMATKVPKMYGALYNNTQKPKVDVVPTLTAVCSRRMLPSIRQFGPDIIITTHPFAGQMVSHLKEKGKIGQPLVSIMTDYGPHRAYLADGIDAYVVPSQECKDALIQLNVLPEKIYPFGIPVFDTFFEKRDSAALRKELDLKLDIPVILVMAGSFGVTNIMGIYRELEQLEQDFQLVIITGRNKKLHDTFEKLLPKAQKPLKLVFFTTEVEKYMQASDLLITKPGGLTISESLACNLPMVVFDSIPGQEEDNAEFLVRRGMAVRMYKGDSCGEIVHSLLTHPNLLADMKAACQKYDASQACANMIPLMQNLLERESVEIGRQYSSRHRRRFRRRKIRT